MVDGSDPLHDARLGILNVPIGADDAAQIRILVQFREWKGVDTLNVANVVTVVTVVTRLISAFGLSVFVPRVAVIFLLLLLAFEGVGMAVASEIFVKLFSKFDDGCDQS
jgi:hypothetical protein